MFKRRNATLFAIGYISLFSFSPGVPGATDDDRGLALGTGNRSLREAATREDRDLESEAPDPVATTKTEVPTGEEEEEEVMGGETKIEEDATIVRAETVGIGEEVEIEEEVKTGEVAGKEKRARTEWAAAALLGEKQQKE